ncbi:MAG: DUF393 domain-containing protein [Chitinophagaceae bacterium]|nr:DUF393 domain-containing protein [Chitinophagaceae bacterium]
MKNTNKVIIYDDTCPFCGAYTKAFVKAGLVKEKNRIGFNSIDHNMLAHINTERCNNEIPVIDTQTKEVWYGVDALVEILHQKISFIKPVANIKPVKWILLKLYKFISFNRKVIVAPKIKQGSFDCTPDFNLRYRFLFLLIFLIADTLMLYPIHKNIISNSFINHTSSNQLQLAHFILVAINVAIAIRLNKHNGFEYLGQTNMLASVTILLTLPLLMLNKYTQYANPLFNSIYLILITAFIIKEYIRRMKFAGIFQNNTWVIFINIISIAAFFTYLIM